jgi:2-keto-4-pentenoate hydratase/2-oxohepta-3-ene-1,7-dioic acid hydratase in catechol pathway
VCVGKNYLEHVGEVDTHMPGISKTAPPALPIIFTKAPTAVTGPGGGIVFPAGVTHEVDYEGELGVVIGKGGKAIAKEDAFDHVFGYTVINDVTARDVQKRHQQWYLGKSFDGFAPCGPWIVPKRALVDSEGGCDPQKLLIGTTVNGDRRQGSDTGQMIFDIRTLIETVSRCMTLRPGDIIATGTPAGVGAGMDPKGVAEGGRRVRGHRQRSRYLVQPRSGLAITLSSSDNSRIVVVCVTILRVLCVQRCSVVRVIYCSGWTAPTVGHTPKNQFARRLLDALRHLSKPERPRRMTGQVGSYTWR